MPQPIAKADLGHYLGQIPPEIMDTIDSSMLAYMGLVD
jgi:hypothetical protein